MFGKIFTQIFDSTIADDYRVRHLFMDLLVLCDSDGVVDMPRESIARRINVPIKEVNKAIEVLESPDPRSRSPEFEGRRLVRLDNARNWGWQIVNYAKYRAISSEADRRESGRQRVAKHRQKDPSEVNSQKGYVYYAGVPGAKEIKIGFSANPWARVADLQTGRPGITLIAMEAGTLAMEKERHLQFTTEHKEGEWFRYEGELRNFVKCLREKKQATTDQTVVTVVLPPASPSASELDLGGIAKGGRFTKPTIEAVKLQGAKIGLPDSECEKFFDYYEANGWRVGKNPMRLWTAALANWKRHWIEYGGLNGKTNQQSGKQNRGKFDRNAGTLNNPSDYAGYTGKT